MAARRTKAAVQPRPLALGLQGGGAHGAFEWGLIERLLDAPDIEIKAVTAASAGAMNAACLASGLATGGREGAKATLEAFWRAVSDAASRSIFGDSSIWTAAFSPEAVKQSPAWRWTEAWLANFSPYQLNPFNLNPLREVLASVIDFAAIRARSPVQLYVSATAVRTGDAVIFRDGVLTETHLLASAALPTLFQAVELDGEPYWDGGYLANPPLWPLFYGQTPDDVLLVTLNPFARAETPKAPGEIVDRLNEITFNAALRAELRAIAFVRKLLDEGLLKDTARRRYRDMRMHAITADAWLSDLTPETKSDTDWAFLSDLRDRGRKAADGWLAAHGADVGVRASVDIRRFLDRPAA